MADKKMTKLDWYTELISIVKNSDAETKEDMLDFLENQKELLLKKQERSKAKAAEKKEDSDAMFEAIVSLLTSEWQNIDEIMTEVIAFDEIFADTSRAKVSARLTKAVKLGYAEKGTAIYEGGRKLAVYKSAEVSSEEE